MTQGLKERPGSEYSDDWKPPVNDDGLEDSYNAPSATDDNLPEGHPSRSSSPEDLRLGEENGASSPEVAGADSEQSDLDKSGLYSGDDQPGRINKIKGKISRKKALVGGGVAGALVAGIISLISILQGPLQIIHFAQLLQKFHFSNNEDFADGRGARYMIYAATGRAQNSRLGIVGNNVASKWEAKMVRDVGLKPEYGPPNQRFIGFSVEDDVKARHLLEGMKSDGIDVDGNRNGKRFVDLSNHKFSQRRSMIRTVVRGTNTAKVGGTIGSRLLIQRAGIDFHPLKNVKRQAGDSLVKFYSDRKNERATRINQGADLPDGELARQAREVADLPDGRDGLARQLIRAGGGGALVFGALCTVHDIGKGAEAYEYANKMLPMMRLGGQIITTGNQVMSGQGFNMEELGSVMADLYDPETEQSWASARSIQAELGHEQAGPDIPPEAQLGQGIKGETIFDTVSRIPGVSIGCGFINDLVSIIPFVDEASAWIASSTGIDKLFDKLLSFLANGAVNASAQGAELGNLANHGARLAANDQAISMGGRELDDGEVAMLDAYQSVNSQHEASQQSFFARTFNIYDADSLVGKMTMSAPKSPGQVLASLVNSPLNWSSVFSVVTGQLSAQSNYDYGFPEFGFSLVEQNNDSFDDPLANAEAVEPKLDDKIIYDEDGNIKEVIQGLNSKYGKECFNMRVNHESSGTIEPFEAKRYDQIPDKCKGTGDPELMQYRFYIADFVTAHSLACYEGESFSCQQVRL